MSTLESRSDHCWKRDSDKRLWEFSEREYHITEDASENFSKGEDAELRLRQEKFRWKRDKAHS